MEPPTAVWARVGDVRREPAQDERQRGGPTQALPRKKAPTRTTASAPSEGSMLDEGMEQMSRKRSIGLFSDLVSRLPRSVPLPRYHPRPDSGASMPTPADCRVSDTHEWFRVNGNTVTMGITQHAADELTDITYVEMKPAGTTVGAGGSVGEVESVKTTSEIYAAAAGKIVEVNGAVAKDPSLVNSDPYGQGWLVKLEVADSSAILALPDGKAYDAKHGH